MSALKDTLCLVAILVVYGVVGQMDYEDAEAIQEVQQASLPRGHPQCLAGISVVDAEGSSPSERLGGSLALGSAGHERCAPDSGGERARH